KRAPRPKRTLAEAAAALYSEPEGEPRRELILVRVLGVPHDVAAPVGIAPVSLAGGLDVGRRPSRLEAQAHRVARVDLHPQRARPRELAVAADLARRAVEAREGQPGIGGGPGADGDEGARAGVGLTEVVGVDAVVVLDLEVADLPDRRPARLQLALLLA